MQNNNVENKYFRPIHYLGSKLRLLDEIKLAILSASPNARTVYDMFSGSGTVSRFLSFDFNIIATDVQEYSKVLCQAMLFSPTRSLQTSEITKSVNSLAIGQQLRKAMAPMLNFERVAMDECMSGDSSKLADMIEYGSLIDYENTRKKPYNKLLAQAIQETSERLSSNGLRDSSESVASRHWGGLYFSYLQAIEIDIISSYAFALPQTDRSVILSALLSTISDVVNTVGKQFAQPLAMRKKDGDIKFNLISKVRADRSLSIYDIFAKWLNLYIKMPRSLREHYVQRMNVLREWRNLIEKEIDVIYADPPYTRYHYSRYYHVLETICKRDNPAISLTDRGDTTQLSRGKYRVDRHQSDFCIASKADKAFEEMFSISRELSNVLILSYSPYDSSKIVSPRLQTIEGLTELASRYYASVDLDDVSKFKHSKLNSTENLLNTNEKSEILIICKGRL